MTFRISRFTDYKNHAPSYIHSCSKPATNVKAIAADVLFSQTANLSVCVFVQLIYTTVTAVSRVKIKSTRIVITPRNVNNFDLSQCSVNRK